MAGNRTGVLLAAFVVASVAGDARAQTAPSPRSVAGSAFAVSGHTLGVAAANGQSYTIRLFGIDAPELSVVPMGLWARGFLDDLVRDKPVTCRIVGSGGAGQLAGACSLAGEDAASDLSLALVRAGWAWRFLSIKNAPALRPLDTAEAEARKDRRGLWRGYQP